MARTVKGCFREFTTKRLTQSSQTQTNKCRASFKLSTGVNVVHIMLKLNFKLILLESDESPVLHSGEGHTARQGDVVHFG